MNPHDLSNSLNGISSLNKVPTVQTKNIDSKSLESRPYSNKTAKSPQSTNLEKGKGKITFGGPLKLKPISLIDRLSPMEISLAKTQPNPPEHATEISNMTSHMQGPIPNHAEATS